MERGRILFWRVAPLTRAAPTTRRARKQIPITYTTTNLSSWTWQVSVTNLDGHIGIAVPPPTGQLQRFYRAIIVQ